MRSPPPRHRRSTRARVCAALAQTLAFAGCQIGPLEDGGAGGEAGAGATFDEGGTACERYCARLVNASCASSAELCDGDCAHSLASAGRVGSLCYGAALEYVACMGQSTSSGMLCDAPPRTLACRGLADRYQSYCASGTPPGTRCTRLSADDPKCAGSGGLAYLCLAEPDPGCSVGGGIRDSFLFCCSGR